MDTYRFIVLTNPTSPAQEDEYNDWYDNTHLDDVTRVAGFKAAQRFVWAPKAEGEVAPPQKYLSIYEIESDDLAKTFAGLSAVAGTDKMRISDAMSRDVSSYVYKAIGPRKVAK